MTSERDLQRSTSFREQQYGEAENRWRAENQRTAVREISAPGRIPRPYSETPMTRAQWVVAILGWGAIIGAIYHYRAALAKWVEIVFVVCWKVVAFLLSMLGVLMSAC